MYHPGAYRVVGKSVLLHGRPVRGADPASFVHLKSNWACDNKAVYWDVFRRTKIDRTSFRPLNGIWGVDARAVFNSYGKVVPGADPITFAVFDTGIYCDSVPSLLEPNDEGFAGDSRNVYYHHSASPASSLLNGCNPLRFQSYGRYGKDDLSVYYKSSKVKNADTASFYLIGSNGHAADQNHV